MGVPRWSPFFQSSVIIVTENILIIHTEIKFNLKFLILYALKRVVK